MQSMNSRRRQPALSLLAVFAVCGSALSCSADTQTPESSAETATIQPQANSADEPAGTDATSRENITPPKPGQVLRHAVFFRFNEDSSEADVQGVIDAFRELPSKVDSITDFEWGTNNSPEDHDDGFTHCFLLTFKDGAGRAEYLPHDAHKAFGDVLRPHKQDVFVIDYWGTPAEPPVENALRHAVFFKFKEDAAAEDIAKVEKAFAELPSRIDTIKAFEWGKNNSPEKHDDGFTHAFLVTFDSDDGRAAYLPHPEHAAFVEVLLPVLDQVRVLDYFAKE